LTTRDMPIEHIVVDGSNIATEGRSLPSLSQLEEAVAELRRDHPNAEITVIVDATFEHRIDPSELPRFEQAALRGEYVHPPAGAIGRGDAFLLRVAEKVDGQCFPTTRSRSSMASTPGCSSGAAFSAALRCPASDGSSAPANRFAARGAITRCERRSRRRSE